MTERDPRLYSYIVEWDAGLAPNPWWESCTLAVCKPQIRRTAYDGDWLVGLSPKRFNYCLVYAMQVSEILSFDEYYQDLRFSQKIPDLTSIDVRSHLGDNFYHLNQRQQYVQLHSAHSYPDGLTNMAHYQRDLSGKNVLIGAQYYYFGSAGQPIPGDLDFLKVGRAHRCHFSLDETIHFLKYIERQPPGLNGSPRDLQKAISKLHPLSLTKE